MLSALPKLADRDFVVGFLLPALLAASAAAWAFPEVAALGPLRSLAATDEQLSGLVYVVLGVWSAAVLLMAANYALYRVLERYLPPLSLLSPLLARHRRRFRELRSRHDESMAEWANAQRDGRPFPQAKQDEVARLRRELLARYPATEAEVCQRRSATLCGPSKCTRGRSTAPTPSPCGRASPPWFQRTTRRR